MAKKKPVAEVKPRNVISIQMDATFFFQRAVQSLERHHYDKALKYFRKAVDYEPENPVNHCNLAGVLSETGDFEESNRILTHIVEQIDPTMTECYFYLANNYANLEDYERAEEALIHYLEHDPNGHYLEEAEEMMELLTYELDRPTRLTSIKSREGMFEHDRARALLEEGKFSEAVRILEKLVENTPDFLAARNNLALAYYYMGLFDKSMATIRQVLEIDPGNLHALCNVAIFYQHNGDKENLQPLLMQLRKTFPLHHDHVFKLATTMGILSEHETAYRLFRRLLKSVESGLDPCLYHYTAVAAYHIGRYNEAEKLWKVVEKLDPGTEVAPFYLKQVQEVRAGQKKPISYHYHLPFEEQFRVLETAEDGIPDHLRRDPLVRSSFFWALRHGDAETKLQVIQAFGIIADNEVEDALREFLMDPKEDEYLKKVAMFVLRSMRAKEPIQVHMEGKQTAVQSIPWSPNLPTWKEQWQAVMDRALQMMEKRYDMIQQHDLETLWVEFLTRMYPSVPKITKIDGWAAALEYLTAKMHRRQISYNEVAARYGVSTTTVSKYVKVIDDACGLKAKMAEILPKLTRSEQR
ncbi:MAG: tetratricopeptide repeat protein [Paenibacillus sp.]|jgi:tetratricopeptide (TPR) repeat protein|nr:tetratricopeptide repeat protein [Paenibacillus sp.]